MKATAPFLALMLFASIAHSAFVDDKAFDTNQFNATHRHISIKAGGIQISNLNDEVVIYITDVGSNTAVTVVNNIVTNYAPVTFDLLQVYPVDQGTNYWLDFGRVNALGQRHIYQTITATNDVHFIGATNCVFGSLLSFNVIASGGNRVISFLTNDIPHPDTNLLTRSGPYFTVTLTNTYLFRSTWQSNNTMEVLCYTPEQ